jgi:hypothetical protein
MSVAQSVISFVVSLWTIELEPEVTRWLDSLAPGMFAVVAARIERLSDVGASLRMPHSRSLGDGLFELRFALGRNAQRITFFPGRGANCLADDISQAKIERAT